MKKLTLIAVLLLVLGLSSGFALDLKPGLTLSGSASVAWGVDLSDMSTGFTNAASGDLVITLLPADSSDPHKGSGALYGSITISDLEYVLTDGVISAGGHEPAFAASIFLPPIQIDIFGAPSMTANAIGPIEDITANGVFGGLDKTLLAIQAIIDDEGGTVGLTSAYAGNGLDIKYTDAGGLFWFQGDIKSADTAAANNAQGYAFGAEAGVTIAPIGISFGVFQGMNYASNPLAGYANLTLTLAGVGTASAGVDVNLLGAAFSYEIGASAQMNFNKDGTAYLLGKLIVRPDLTPIHLDALIGLMIPANSLMGPLSVTAAAYILDVLSANENSIYGTVGYQIDLSDTMYVKPQVTADYGLAAGGVNLLNINPSVEIGIAKAPLTTITIGWTSGDLMAATPGLGSVAITAKVTY